MADKPVILPTYQLPAIEMTREDFFKLPLRDDLGHDEHNPDQLYRTRYGYHGDAFMWVPIDDPNAGEWHRAPVTFITKKGK